jgi:hypothetical protein
MKSNCASEKENPPKFPEPRFPKRKYRFESEVIKKLSESRLSVLLIGVFGSLFLAFAGLLTGAWISQFLIPAFPMVIIIPLVMTATIGFLLIKRKRTDAGEALLYAGVIASVALPLILL